MSVILNAIMWHVQGTSTAGAPQILSSVLGLSLQNVIEVLESVQTRAKELGKGLGHMFHKEWELEIQNFPRGKPLRPDLNASHLSCATVIK